MKYFVVSIWKKSASWTRSCTLFFEFTETLSWQRVLLALSEWVKSVIFLPSPNIGIKLASSAAQVQKTNIIITQNDHCKCSEKFFQLSMVLLIHQHSWNEHMILRAFLLRPPIWNKTFWNITLCSCRRKYLLAWVGFLYVNLSKLQKYQTPPTLSYDHINATPCPYHIPLIFYAIHTGTEILSVKTASICKLLSVRKDVSVGFWKSPLLRILSQE